MDTRQATVVSVCFSDALSSSSYLQEKHTSTTKIRIKRLLIFIPLSDLESISPHTRGTHAVKMYFVGIPSKSYFFCCFFFIGRKFLFCLWTEKPVIGTTNCNTIKIYGKAKVPRQ